MPTRPQNPAAIGADRTQVILNNLIDMGCLDTAGVAILIGGLANLANSTASETTRKRASIKMAKLVQAGFVVRLHDQQNGNGAVYFPTKAGAEQVGRMCDYLPPPCELKATTRHRLLANRFLLVAKEMLDLRAKWSDRQLACRRGPTAGADKQPDAVLKTPDGQLLLVEIENSRRGGKSLKQLSDWLEKILPKAYRNRPDIPPQTGEINGRPIAGIWFVLAPGRQGSCGEILRALARHLRLHHDETWAESAFRLACKSLYFIETRQAAPFFELPPSPVDESVVSAAWSGMTTRESEQSTCKLDGPITDEEPQKEQIAKLELASELDAALARAVLAESEADAWRDEARRLRDELLCVEARRPQNPQPPEHVQILALQAANAATAKAENKVEELQAEIDRLRAELEAATSGSRWFGFKR